jgi:dodecin
LDVDLDLRQANLSAVWLLEVGSNTMQNAVFKIIDLVGSSDKSIEDAIQGAIEHATKTIRGLAWFEVVETRGSIKDGHVTHYQVTLRAGFKLEGS